MMTTRCPHCGAAFRVAPDQLRVRGGLVRCGACQSVFDGHAGLVHEMGPADASLTATPSASSPARPAAPVVPAVPQVLRGRADRGSRAEPILHSPAGFVDDGDGDDEDGGAGFDAVASPSYSAWPGGRSGEAAPHLWRTREPADDGLDDEPGFLDDEGPSSPAQPWHVRGEARTRQIDSLDSGRAPPPFMDDERQERSRVGRLAWVVGSLVGLLLLAAQGLMVYRSQLALAFPPLRPVLTLLCQPLNCTVGYARRIERISIMSSSLRRSSESGAPDALVLNVVMRNRYDQPQEWPSLMLSLNDMSDTVVARRVLGPADYLPPWTAGRGPFAPGQEVTLAVPVDPGTLAVNGYRIDKFFP